MYYTPHLDKHGLAHDPFKALVAPRPIGWISSCSAQGELNLAPYSFFNAVSAKPPIVMFSSDGEKDTVTNIMETGEFVCNMVSWSLKDHMNQTSAPYDPTVNEFESASLSQVPSSNVSVPRVKECLAALECVLLSAESLKDKDLNPVDNIVVFGQVVGVYIDDSVIVEGKVSPERLSLIGRSGYKDYVQANTVFEMTRPGS